MQDFSLTQFKVDECFEVYKSWETHRQTLYERLCVMSKLFLWKYADIEQIFGKTFPEGNASIWFHEWNIYFRAQSGERFLLVEFPFNYLWLDDNRLSLMSELEKVNQYLSSKEDIFECISKRLDIHISDQRDMQDQKDKLQNEVSNLKLKKARLMLELGN